MHLNSLLGFLRCLLATRDFALFASCFFFWVHVLVTSCSCMICRPWISTSNSYFFLSYLCTPSCNILRYGWCLPRASRFCVLSLSSTILDPTLSYLAVINKLRSLNMQISRESLPTRNSTAKFSSSQSKFSSRNEDIASENASNTS